jgi:hypothetical protein
MKVVCPSCERLIDVTAVRVVGADVFLGCAKCGVESSLPVTADALPTFEAPKAAPPLPMSSRKTPGPRALVLASSAEASNVVMLRAPTTAAVDSARAFADQDPFEVPEGLCPKCVSPRAPAALACPTCGLIFSRFRPASTEPPADLAAMWRELLREWGDDDRHAAIRRLAHDRAQLPELARLYRIRLAAMPDDPIAQRGRDEVLTAATAVMMLPRAPPEDQRGSRLMRFVVGAFAVLIILGALAGLIRLVK